MPGKHHGHRCAGATMERSDAPQPQPAVRVVGVLVLDLTDLDGAHLSHDSVRSRLREVERLPASYRVRLLVGNTCPTWATVDGLKVWHVDYEVEGQDYEVVESWRVLVGLRQLEQVQ